MNILVCINDRYVDALVVMLESLIEHNKDVRIFCLYSNLSKNNKKFISQHVNVNGVTISFIYTDNTVYKDFPVTERLTYECYLVLLAHLLLPKDMDRILYLDCDLIVDGCLEELYKTDISNVYLAACGQYYKKMDGKWFLPYSRPEKGECFNSGVLLLNLPLLRRDITLNTYKSVASEYNNVFSLADQGILNIVFYSKTKYLDTMKWNFRISIFEDFIRDGNSLLSYKPLVYHYVTRDYYKVGLAAKPWELFFNEAEYDYLSFSGIAKREYGDVPIVKMNLFMQQLWWKYAEKCNHYESLFLKMKSFKEDFFKERLDGHRKELLEFRRIILNFEKVTNNGDVDEVLEYRYSDLEKYIDNISPEMAIQTMNNIHRCSLDNLKNKEKIKVAFMVYSSSEWQCEKIYRLMEADERFEPVIFVCGYAHGTDTQIKKTYLDVCSYFFNSGRNYKIEYGGYTNAFANKSIDSFDLIIYIIPFNGMINSYYNVQHRKLCQLLIYMPYGYYLQAYDKLTYGLSYMDMIIFKVGWLIVKTDKLTFDYDASMARLKSYNSLLIGLPKIDSLYDCSVRKNLWKTSCATKKKIIWAPHFNIQKGMNGTFHTNYNWFLQYAKKHKEISWIIRPHPRMRRMLVDLGVFKSEGCYDKYLNDWEQLPNARVLEYGDYFDAFSSSDAMILDSISFVAEYQFTGKPLLFLLSDFPRHLSPLGEELHKHLYRCSGSDFLEIENFINNVCKNEDIMKTSRLKFFEDNLNYFRWNQKGASESFMCYIKSRI